jgi:para-nitrobenzyl esterase
MSDPIVATTAGAIRGRAESSRWSFLGIPYAAPPTGAARFTAPAPHAPWRQVRDATEPGPAAPQASRRGFGALDMSPYFGDVNTVDPDYLTVNVWAPAGAGSSPVMVFVHGGGFVSGSTRSPLYSGAAFARDGVVLVTVTYRLGIVGFLDLPDAPANRGLLDVVAALNWVRANIAAFGGDPNNVTLFGQSAGATIVSAILAMPDAPRLIRRAIIQSGNGLGAFLREQAARVTQRVAALLAVEPTVAGLSSVPDHQLVAIGSQLAGLSLRTARHFDPLAGLSAFSLVLDRQPADTVATGVGAQVPLLIGTNSQEGNLYLVPQGKFETSTERDVYELAAQTHTDAAAVVNDYRTRLPEASWGELRSAILGDALFGRGSRRLADAHGSHRAATTHRYEFCWHSPAVGGLLGAAHTVELPFVFDHLDAPALRGPRGLLGPGDPPARLAARMHDAWVSYARTGNPGWATAHTHHFIG